MDYFNLIVGILLIIGCGAYLYHLIIREIDREEDTDYMLLSFNIKIVVGTIIFFVMGIIMVYREVGPFL